MSASLFMLAHIALQDIGKATCQQVTIGFGFVMPTAVGIDGVRVVLALCQSLRYSPNPPHSLAPIGCYLLSSL